MYVGYERGVIVWRTAPVGYDRGVITFRNITAVASSAPPEVGIVGDKVYQKRYPVNQSRDFPVHIPWTVFPHE